MIAVPITMQHITEMELILTCLCQIMIAFIVNRTYKCWGEDDYWLDYCIIWQICESFSEINETLDLFYVYIDVGKNKTKLNKSWNYEHGFLILEHIGAGVAV